MPFLRRFRSKSSYSIRSFPKQQKTTNKKKRRFQWSKFILQGSIPLSIAIFTIISYIQTQQIDARQREQDLEIANKTRAQDLLIADLARMKDWNIAQTGLDIANETRIQDRQLVDEQREDDRQLQQDLHHQELYSKYIDDISTIIYKQPQLNQPLFLDDEAKYLYIRRKTLLTLKEIDSERRSQLFIFLYENDLLPDRTKLNKTISLEGADLHNITIKSSLSKKYIFNELTLESVNLVNSTFIDCIFVGGSHFIDSSMSNISFINSRFECVNGTGPINIFAQVSLDYSKFEKTSLCTTKFNVAKLIGSSFIEVGMQQVSFINTNLSSTRLDVTQKGIVQLNNVILPNGTWFSSVPPAANISSCARWNQNGTTLAGNQIGLSGSNLSMLHSPGYMYINIFDNTLYVGDTVNERVIKFQQNKSRGQVVAQDLGYVHGIYVDREQNLYVGQSNKILKISLDLGASEIIAGGSSGKRLDELNGVTGLMLDEEKNLYISDSSNHRIVMFKPNAKMGVLLVGVVDKRTTSEWDFDEPQGIYIDSFFNTLYAADSSNNRIQRFHPIGNETGETVAGGADNGRGSGLHQLLVPTSVMVLNNRDIYVADTGNHRIVRWILGDYSANGTCVVGCTGGSGISANMLKKPIDFKFDDKGNLIVSDTYNHRIQKFDLVNNEC